MSPCCQQENSQNSVAALVLSVCYYAYGAHFGCNFMRVRLELRYVWQRRIVPVVRLQLSLSPPPPLSPPLPPPHTHSLSQSASYTCQVSGPGLKSATVNHPTHVLVELRDSSGRPCSQRQNVTAKLEHVPQATPSHTHQPTSDHTHQSISKTCPCSGIQDVSLPIYMRCRTQQLVEANTNSMFKSTTEKSMAAPSPSPCTLTPLN